jgi:hypothetical protein
VSFNFEYLMNKSTTPCEYRGSNTQNLHLHNEDFRLSSQARALVSGEVLPQFDLIVRLVVSPEFIAFTTMGEHRYQKAVTL